MGTRVFLLRHGQSTYNAMGLYQGCCDQSTLTETGQVMAQQMGKQLHPIHFDAFYASPLQRAQQTAHQVLTHLEMDPYQLQLTPLLCEAHLPAWEGLSFQTVRDTFTKDYQTWKQDPHLLAMTVAGTEFYPALDLYWRAQQFWQEILPFYRGQTLLVVAHGGTNRAAIATALGIDPAHYHTIEQSNCGLNILHFSTGDQMSAQLEVVNQVTHMGSSLSQLQDSKGLQIILVPTMTSQPDQNQKLATLLASIPIHFSLNNPSDGTQQTLETLLHFHPKTVQLQIQQPDFLEIWHRQLRQSRYTYPKQSEQLTTGLVVAHPEAIAAFIGQTIGLPPDQSWRLWIQPGTFSLVHYPAVQTRPVLKAMNLAITGSLDHLVQELPQLAA